MAKLLNRKTAPPQEGANDLDHEETLGCEVVKKTVHASRRLSMNGIAELVVEAFSHSSCLVEGRRAIFCHDLRGSGEINIGHFTFRYLSRYFVTCR
jgi:hypothetical protein